MRKSGIYDFYKTNELRLIYLNAENATFITHDSKIGEMCKFYKNNDGETYYTLQVLRNNTYSAYLTRNFCTYNEDKFYIYNSQEGFFIISPYDPNVNKKYGHHPIADFSMKVKEEEIKEIWEEREPVEGFIFDVEPIVYLKKN